MVREKRSQESLKNMRKDNVIPVVVVVDIDDDVGEVLGRSLVYGEKDVEKAILEYGLKRPADPDVNAMLAGLSLYKKFKKEKGNAEIIIVGGHPIDFVEAQRNIRARVESVISKLNGVPEFYIVSDGEDEFVVSQVLGSLGIIGGFERVIVEQDLGIEGRYILILKYLKKAMFEPRFSKYLLGIPGIALSIFALLSLVGLAQIALKTAGLIIGIAMFLRGFNLEEVVEGAFSTLARRVKEYILGMGERPYLKLSGLIILVLALIISSYSAYSTFKESGVEISIRAARVFQTSIPVLGAGAITYIFITKIFYKIIYEEKGILKSILNDILAIDVIFFLSSAFYSLGAYIIKNKPEVFTVSVFLDSGFLQLVIAGTGIAAIIEMIRRMYKQDNDENYKTENNSSSSISQSSSAES